MRPAATPPGPRRLVRAILWFSVVLAGGCGEDATGPAPEAVLAAPTRVTVDGVEVRLQADPWRNMQPNGDDRLAVVLGLRPTGTAPVPSGIRMERVWVVYGDDAWEARPRQERYDVVARGGPRWPVGGRVVVVLRFSTAGGELFLVRDPEAVIEGPV